MQPIQSLYRWNQNKQKKLFQNKEQKYTLLILKKGGNFKKLIAEFENGIVKWTAILYAIATYTPFSVFFFSKTNNNQSYHIYSLYRILNFHTVHNITKTL